MTVMETLAVMTMNAVCIAVYAVGKTYIIMTMKNVIFALQTTPC